MAYCNNIATTYKSRRNKDYWITAPRIKSERTPPKSRTALPKQETNAVQNILNVSHNNPGQSSRKEGSKPKSKIAHLLVPNIQRCQDIPRSSTPLPIEEMTEINKEGYRNSYVSWRNGIEHTASSLFIVRGSRWMGGEYISGHIMEPITKKTDSYSGSEDEFTMMDKDFNDLVMNKPMRKIHPDFDENSSDEEPLLPNKKSAVKRWASPNMCYRLCGGSRYSGSDSDDIEYTIDKNGYAVKNLQTIITRSTY